MPLDFDIPLYPATRCSRLAMAGLLLGCLWSTAGPAQTLSPADAKAMYQAVVADPARSEADRTLDIQRKPVEFLAFAGVQPGMRVLDVASGAGYTAELLARAVGPTGHVFAQVEEIKPALSARLQPLQNVTIAQTGTSDPVPIGARPLDLITVVLSYHDFTYMSLDRKSLNKALFDALKPGGALILIDHSAKPGSGARDGQTLHRVDEALVKKELTDAGFVLDRESDFLRNPNDPRDQAFFNMPTMVSDRFALRFVKPL